MSQLKPVRAGLDVGFGDAGFPECFAGLKGPAWRSIPITDEFPFVDEQFDAVVLHGSIVTPKTVREAHRVLKPAGRLYFIVPEKTKGQNGFTMPDIYATVRGGYDISEVARPKWWWFGLKGRTFTICATKKHWRSMEGAKYRPYL